MFRFYVPLTHEHDDWYPLVRIYVPLIRSIRAGRRKVAQGRLRPHFAYFFSALEFSNRKTAECAACYVFARAGVHVHMRVARGPLPCDVDGHT